MIVKTRRDVLTYAALGGAALTAGLPPRRGLAQPLGQGPVADTTLGKVRGSTVGGAHLFKGIPYGGSVAGPGRFMPPPPARSWTGVRDATVFGPIAMQTSSPEHPKGTFYEGIWQPSPVTMNEDCLVLNVWTPAVADGGRRPVIFWCHGGGFAGGAGSQGWTDATNLAAEHDVVVVSFNHRLNIFGSLFLEGLGGGKYNASGDVGMLDVLAALKWVRDNIAAFGGDRNNITIAGHSGGGAKVSILMAMPEAHGLFHKAIQMSGPGLKMLDPESAHRTAEHVLRQLAISPSQVDRLQTVPPEALLKAMQGVMKEDDAETWKLGSGIYRAFAPVVDGRILPRHPFFPDAPALSKHIPLLVGSGAEEARAMALSTPSFGSMDAQSVRLKLEAFGVDASRADRLIAGYRQSRPDASFGDIYSAILSDLAFRADAIAIAERKSAQQGAPVYMYLFAWNSPAENGRLRSTHGVSLPFAFDNLSQAPGLLGGQSNPPAQQLAHSMGKAWATFARTGNPNHAGLPEWRPYSNEKRATMVFGATTETVDDPLGHDRIAFQS